MAFQTKHKINMEFNIKSTVLDIFQSPKCHLRLPLSPNPNFSLVVIGNHFQKFNLNLPKYVYFLPPPPLHLCLFFSFLPQIIANISLYITAKMMMWQLTQTKISWHALAVLPDVCLYWRCRYSFSDDTSVWIMNFQCNFLVFCVQHHNGCWSIRPWGSKAYEF